MVLIMEDFINEHIIIARPTPDTFYRHCENCGKGMNEGYIIEDGAFCSLACAGWTQAEWDEAYDDEGDNYWTEWEEGDE